jgi:hypothetical protein
MKTTLISEPLALITYTSARPAITPRRQYSAATVSRSWYESVGETFVAVMQATDLRDGDDSSDLGWLDRARVPGIFVE